MTWDEIFGHSALGMQAPGDRQLLLALEPQPTGEKDISICGGRVGLITGGKKRKRCGESELLLPVNEKRPCWALGVLPAATPNWSESHGFGNTS